MARRPTRATKLDEVEDEILNIFVDICSLFQRQPEVDGSTGGEAPSAEAYLFSYLRMLETQGEKLPAAFVDALRRVLAHYGVQTLDRSPALEESLLWICKSHQRVGQQINTDSGRARTAPGARANPVASACRRGILSHASRPDDLRDSRAVSRRQRHGPRGALPLL